MKMTPTYVKDAKDFICAIERLCFPQDCVFIPLDVICLYPTIPIDASTRKNFTDYLTDLSKFPESRINASEIPFLVELLWYVLLNNFLTFDGKVYKQVSGTAMGTPVAVAFANIFMSIHDFLCQKKLAELGIVLLFKGRFIDDCAIVAKREDAERIVQIHQAIHPAINFTWNINDTDMVFLDLLVFKSPDFATTGKLSVKLHQKPMNTYGYLHPGSNHPPHVFSSFIKAEIRRIRVNCTYDSDFLHFTDLFKTRLANRGYLTSVLDPLFRFDPIPDRHSLLYPLLSLVSDKSSLVLVTEYSPISATVGL